MTGRLEGKVAFITGAARGQGRSHSIRLAEEGADIIGVDICEQIKSVGYPLGTQEDLDETVAAVEKTGRKIIAVKGDVRERAELRVALEAGLAEFGRLDIVCANAGILPLVDRTPTAFMDSMDVDLLGVMNTVSVTLPHLRAGSSIIITGSTAGLMPGTVTNPVLGPGGIGYGLAKTVLVQYTETLASQLGPESIRVNIVHPTNVDTNLIHNAEIYKVFRPDLESPAREDVLDAFATVQAMPIPYVDTVDISNAVLFLASDESRYVTGVNLRVDAGALLLPAP